MTAHADIARVYPRTHRRAVLLGAHLDTLPLTLGDDGEPLPLDKQPQERRHAQVVYDRVWQAMASDEIGDDSQVPDDLVRVKKLDADTEEEARDHVLATPEGEQVLWTRTERRLTEAGRARLEATTM